MVLNDLRVQVGRRAGGLLSTSLSTPRDQVPVLTFLIFIFSESVNSHPAPKIPTPVPTTYYLLQDGPGNRLYIGSLPSNSAKAEVGNRGH